MPTSSFHRLFEIQPVSIIASPQPTFQKNVGKAPQALRDVGILPEIELESIKSKGNHGKTNGSPPGGTIQDDVHLPKTPSELELSRPSTPKQPEGVGVMRTLDNPMTKCRVLCCSVIYFANGMNDSVVGALIPYMESWYHISYSIMSLVFVGNAFGSIVAAFFTNMLLAKYGRAKTLIIAELFQLTACIMLVSTPHYLLVIAAFFLIGFGAAISVALNNVYCAHTFPSSVILGIAHGAYGLGGIVAPIIGTAIVSKGIPWSRFYIISIGLRLTCIAFSAWSFWSFQEDSDQPLLSNLEPTTSRQSKVEEAVSKLRELKLALKNRVTIFGAFFIFAYQGAEVSISGWFISYLINYRDGDPAKVGYVTAGFWGGITLGRFFLTPAAHTLGEKSFVVILTLGSFALQLLAWLTPNLIGNAVAVSLLGFLLGPVYPCAQTIFSRLLPRNIQTTAVSFIGSAGSSGGAVAPFTTGILAQAAGTWVLHPVCIGLYAAMMACWMALPRVQKRTE